MSPNPSVFPVESDSIYNPDHTGITLLDFFAGMAIMGKADLRASSEYREKVAEEAYILAYNMLCARTKHIKEP